MIKNEIVKVQDNEELELPKPENKKMDFGEIMLFAISLFIMAIIMHALLWGLKTATRSYKPTTMESTMPSRGEKPNLYESLPDAG